jgi:multiple sugar transport system substrate-binding protein
MKKPISVSIVLLAAVLIVAGCSRSGGKSTGSSEATGLSGDLTMWHYFQTDIERNGVQKVADKFMVEHPNVKVTLTFVPRDELLKQLTLGAVSGELPGIAVMDNPDTAAFIQMGIFLDITDKFNAWDEKQFYYEGPLNSCKADGKIYGLPHNSNCVELFYDVDQLNAAGVKPPNTWNELLNVCAALKQTYPNLYPFGFSAANSEEGTFQFIPFLLSTGATLDNLASPEAIKAAAFWKELVDKGYVPRDVISWGQNELNAQFMAGNVIMQTNGPWNVSALRAEAPAKNWNVSLLPKDAKYASVLGGENFAITTACDPELGWAFLSTICNGQNVAEFCAENSRFSPRSDGSKYSNVWDSDPVLKVFNEGMQYAMPRGPHPRWNEFSGVVSTALQEILIGAKSPVAAMRDAQTASETIMKQ